MEVRHIVFLCTFLVGIISCTKAPAQDGEEFTYTDVRYWKFNKVNIAPSLTVDGMNALDKTDEDERDSWGGYDGVKPDRLVSTNTDGFWHTGYRNGHKVFVNPDGNVSFLCGMNSVCPEPIFSTVHEKSIELYKNKFGDGEQSAQKWAGWAAPILAGNGFNFINIGAKRIKEYRINPSAGWGISNATEAKLVYGDGKHKLSNVANLFMLRTFMWDYKKISGKGFKAADQSEFTLMFDPDFVERCTELAEFAATGDCKFRDNKSFIGYYLDNELPFVTKTSDYPKVISLREFLNLDESKYRCNKAAREWATKWMENTYGTTAYDESMEKPFLKAVARYYYGTLSEIIRKADPNHLILGSRLHGDAARSRELIEACAEFCDVVTFNFYSYWDITKWPNIDQYTVWTKDKPIMLTEFYSKDKTLAFDGELYTNNEGAGWIVYGQQARGQYYQNTVISFIRNRNVAGWQYFKWSDDYKTSVTPSGWVNKGVFAPDYSEVYQECMSLMKQVNINAYRILDYNK